MVILLLYLLDEIGSLWDAFAIVVECYFCHIELLFKKGLRSTSFNFCPIPREKLHIAVGAAARLG